MKEFTFQGQVSGLMWAIIRAIGIMMGSMILATIVSNMVDNRLVNIGLTLFVLAIMVFAMPFVVNSIIKYLVEHTKLDGKNLGYRGSAMGILSLVIIAMVVWSLLTLAFVGVVFWIHASNLSGGWIYGLLSLLYIGMITFFFSWVVLQLYHWSLRQTSISEK
ncbi:hypothetical protein PVA45_02330 [Entomospira entomophila]|uniref:Uncharacterized protein n=1 Tax=Entomospira entomophila TaxID=2719988 RepID=A0A968KR17_9SPIO|nr:hypothetical protein [Entomospira entomophilus]NIZ40349.1 hypothetical protein [Entomospira entomophilus]WDI35908.1 hypothetical protein PVA45_02330 [Entomospira entomophilus]